MATFYLREYRYLSGDKGGKHIQAGHEDGYTTDQTDTFAASTQSNAFQNDTEFVRITCDASAFIKFGDNPTATATGVQVQANTPEFFGVTPGQKAAFYDGTT